jgi:hypothetical protein
MPITADAIPLTTARTQASFKAALVRAADGTADP